MENIRSLGETCEVGLVQRFCDAEPLGLFRFTSCHIQHLIDAFETDFTLYGSPGDLELFDGTEGDVWCRSRRYDFAYCVGKVDQGANSESTLEKQYKRLDFLKRLMLEDLVNGEKLLVRKSFSKETVDDYSRLAESVRRHGSANVMWVEETLSEELAGRAHWLRPGLMKGYVKHYPRYPGSMPFDLQSWVALCSNAYALSRSQSAPELFKARHVRITSDKVARRHRTQNGAGALTLFRNKVDLTEFAGGTLGVFSAWVWIPEDFEGERVGCFVKFADAYHQFWHHGADLRLRDRWQRIWISLKIPKGIAAVAVGISAESSSGSVFFSAFWQYNDGPAPASRIAPTASVGITVKDRLKNIVSRFVE